MSIKPDRKAKIDMQILLFGISLGPKSHGLWVGMLGRKGGPLDQVYDLVPNNGLISCVVDV